MTAWQDFLMAHGASLDAYGQLQFPTAPITAASGCQVYDLSQFGLIAAQGAEAAEFLQGQLTNDIRELSDTHTQLSAHCNHKGRILTLFHALRLGDTIYLQAPRERITDSLQRLSRFILRAQVTLTNASETLIRIGVAGDSAPALLAAQGLPIPERDYGLAQTAEIAVMRLPSIQPRFELIGAFELMREQWIQLAAQAQIANTVDWTRLNIQAGMPTVYQQTVETFIPQMLNLQALDGVSFNKGCYTGQEVVARMQFLGKLKRRMYYAEVESMMPPVPGAELYVTASASQQTDGWVVDSCPLDAGRYALLVVIEIAACNAGEIRLGAADGPQLLAVREPPYGFADAGN